MSDQYDPAVEAARREAADLLAAANAAEADQ